MDKKTNNISDNMCDIKEIGIRLHDVRRHLIMTQAQLAEATGVPMVTISRIEHGESTSSVALCKLLAFFSQSVSLDFLFSKDFSIADADIYGKSFSMGTIVKAKIEMIRDEAARSLDKTKEEILRQLTETTELL